MYLTFSDGAKFGLIAKNLFEGKGFMTDFSFWGNSGIFSTGGVSPLVPYSMVPFFHTFGATDLAVISSSFFYFLLLICFTFLLGKKLHGSLVGVLSALAVGLNLNFIDYATSGASEVVFTLLLVVCLYLVSQRNKFTDLLTFLTLLLMYFARPQAFIYMAGVVFYYLIVNFKTKKGLSIFVVLGILALVIDKFIIYPLSFKYPVTPVLIRGLQSILTYSSSNAVSDAIRGGEIVGLTFADVLKKVFYNLYNFYKALPEIANPYLWGLFFIGQFIRTKNTIYEKFKITILFITTLTFVVTALTIPFYRYLHPVVPIVYIIAVATLVNFLSQSKFYMLSSATCILFLVVGQTLGHFILDSRFEKRLVNSHKPPVYVLLSHKLKDVTGKDDLILTNLDTWGSWYGERKTVWFPLEPSMLENSKFDFDAIYLTSYKMDDENYYMGEAWREIFENPESQTALPGFEFKEKFIIDSSQVYENYPSSAILLVNKNL